MKKSLIACLVVTWKCALDCPGQSSFVAAPTAERHGERRLISFAVSAPTCVEVSICDKAGHVVRHLAAGMLGKNAPDPFQKDSLTQQITWDGKDDAGKPAGEGPFRVRVALGLQAVGEKALGWNPTNPGFLVVGLAVGTNGEVYVLDAWSRLKVFDAKGNYLRTIMPYSAALSHERVESMGQLEVEGERLPVVYSAHYGTFHPLMSGLKKRTMVFSPKGYLLMTTGVGTKEEHGMPRHLAVLAPDGGTPAGMRFLGPRIREPVNYLGGDGERGTIWFDHLAVSRDGEWIYLNQAGESRHFKRVHGVFRLKWTDRMPEQPFVGRAEPGDDEGSFNDPQGIAVDRQGNLYVCDRGNNRVAVFAPDAKPLGRFTVEMPEQIAIHPATGAIYIISRGRDERGRGKPDTVLRKFNAWAGFSRDTAPRERYSLAVKNIDLLAVDPSAEPPRLWIAVGGGWGGTSSVIPVFDKGDSFEAGKPITSLDGLQHPQELAVDTKHGKIIVREYDAVFLTRRYVRINLKDGSIAPLKLTDTRQGPSIACDAEGNLYVAGDYNTDVVCSRYDPEGRPLPFAATGTHQLRGERKNPHWSRGIAVGPDGTIYVLLNVVRHHAGELVVYGPDGQLRKKDLIPGLDRGANGIGVDGAGNVYIGINLKTREKPYPSEFMGKIPDKMWWFWYPNKLFGDRPEPWSGTFYNPYLYHWGCIMKFGPEGGAIYGMRNLNRPGASWPQDGYSDVSQAPQTAVSFVTGCLEQEVKVVGAKWFRSGFGIVANSLTSWGDPCCLCAMAGFAVDAYGRVYYPNPFRFCLEVLDTAGNLVARIGRYGNADDLAAALRSRAGEVCFAWPAFTAIAERKLYVSDAINQQVVVVRLDASTGAECEMP
ncbi:MAG: hypothetical protein N2255_02085 [Kiritimatiellae bacterium]|nr:hypothetical protein [Kiritimatiellia bacterium]